MNASGPRAALTARMAGLDVPVEPRKRTLFVVDPAESPQGSATVNGGRLPLMIDPSGTFCRPEGRYFPSVCAPVEDPAVAWGDFGIAIDRDGKAWFPRIFGQSGYALVPHPEKLTQVLPAIDRQLVVGYTAGNRSKACRSSFPETITPF